MATAIEYGAIFGLAAVGYTPNFSDVTSKTQRVPIAASGRLAFVETVEELDGVAVDIAFRWMPRLSRWWYQVRSPAGVVLGQGLAQAGGGIAMDTRDARVPPGRLFFVGPDDYAPDDLGDSLRLRYQTAGPERLPPTYGQYLAAVS